MGSKVPDKAGIMETTVFESGQEGYLCYRIPAIVKAPNGDLLAFAEARRTSCSDFGDVEIVLKRSSDDGRSWGPLQVVADYAEYQAGNPAPVYDLTDPAYPKGRLFLFYNTGTAHEADVRKGKAVREIWYKTSTDGAHTWNDPVNITLLTSRPNAPNTNPTYTFSEDWRSYANTPGHALQIRNGKYRGRIFVAANHSAGPPQEHYRDYAAHAYYSDDHGQTFKLSPSLDYAGGNEATAAETSDGSLLLNFRNQSGDVKYRLQGFTRDAGTTWEEVRVMEGLPDPVCEGSLISYQPKKGQPVLLFSNANSQTKRENLTVRTSPDNGQTWSSGQVIYSGSAAYSDLVVQADDKIGVLYEKDAYKRIVYAQFEYSWLRE
ncbi:exo-alpha-sialidase [Cytophagaceae bacterium SJW1-29]|uniref:exo-alpha-sialidase n=2 Tax=Salmonirosea aquatica TaxID=2654236 RepID=A0A7C9BIW0_9BACT|nr:exo-alpha-sialidase [Cytophagaceae bacterium SJW1-29]